ncbi:MAG: hypothetical protein QOD90_6196, partial [Mycobacterium sp.]|nr:hypothetical protein [Mycobacterium sp.]
MRTPTSRPWLQTIDGAPPQVPGLGDGAAYDRRVSSPADAPHATTRGSAVGQAAGFERFRTRNGTYER